jgi:hypothetical protein
LIGSFLQLIERRTVYVIVVIGVLFTLAYVTNLVLFPKPDGRVLIGDAVHHYVQLRSAVIDHDLQFRNDYIRMYRLQGGEKDTDWVYENTATGHVRNYMPVGPAILWAPLFLLVWAGASLANFVGAGWPVDGYSRLYQATAGISGVLAATAGVVFSWRLASSVFSARAAAWATLVMWLSSSAIYYSLVSPTYSHAASLLATSAFWYVFVRTRESSDFRRYALLGALAGFAALMRWQDAILLASIVFDLGWRLRARAIRLREALITVFVAAGAALLVFVPQMIVWMSLYGRPLAMPQGSGFMRWTEPALSSVLFSDWHGLFTWTPITAIAVVGFVPLWKGDRRTAAAAAVFLLLSWYVNAAVADWWAGEAFGSRRFVSCFPVFALSLAALVDWWRPRLPNVTLAGGAIVTYSFLLLVQYQTFMHGLRDLAPYPGGVYNLWLARFVVPIDLLRRWLDR